jgi:hypothetical protein
MVSIFKNHNPVYYSLNILIFSLLKKKINTTHDIEQIAFAVIRVSISFSIHYSQSHWIPKV